MPILLWYCFTASAEEKAIYKGSPGCTPSDSKVLPLDLDPMLEDSTKVMSFTMGISRNFSHKNAD